MASRNNLIELFTLEEADILYEVRYSIEFLTTGGWIKHALTNSYLNYDASIKTQTRYDVIKDNKIQFIRSMYKPLDKKEITIALKFHYHQNTEPIKFKFKGAVAYYANGKHKKENIEFVWDNKSKRIPLDVGYYYIQVKELNNGDLPIIIQKGYELLSNKIGSELSNQHSIEYVKRLSSEHAEIKFVRDII